MTSKMKHSNDNDQDKIVNGVFNFLSFKFSLKNHYKFTKLQMYIIVRGIHVRKVNYISINSHHRISHFECFLIYFFPTRRLGTMYPSGQFILTFKTL